MSLIKWFPFRDLDRFFEDDDFGFVPVMGKAKLFDPSVNLYETEKEVVVEMSVPGFDPKNIDISVEEQSLRVKGHMEEKKEDKEKNYYRKEIKKGSFERVLRLPVSVAGAETKADYEDGILKITMPKSEISKPKSVKIQVKK